MAKEICQLPYFVELWKCLYERQQVKYSKIEEEGHFLLLWPSKRLKGGGCKKPAHSWKIIDYCTAYFIWNCFDGSRHASGICRRCAVQTTWRPSEFGIFVGLSAPGSSILGLFTPKGQEGGGHWYFQQHQTAKGLKKESHFGQSFDAISDQPGLALWVGGTGTF